MTIPTGYIAAFGVATSVVLLALLRVAQRIARPAHTVAKDMASPNVAWRLDQVGETVSVFLLAAAVVENCVTGESILRDVAIAGAFGVAGLIVIQVLGLAASRLLLAGKLREELDRGNAAAGLAAGSHYVAVGILASNAVAGSDLRGLALSLAFFALAQVTHLLFVQLFRALTTYDDGEQIAGENVAAAVSYAGVTIAVAIVVARALEGDFEGWKTSLKGFGLLVAWVLALFPVRQLVVQGLLLGRRPRLRGGALDDAIAQDHDLGMASMEAATYVAAALAIARLA